MAFIGTGITISFATGFFAEILDVTPPGVSRESIQTSHMGTTIAHDFIPSKLVDWGELSVELQFDPGDDPPINTDPEEIIITFPNSAATTWTFQGFMTGYEPSAPLEDKMTASATIKVTGDVTVA